jgi:hypothetical protein
MKTPKLPDPIRAPLSPQAPGGAASFSSAGAGLFGRGAPQLSGFTAKRQGRRSLIGG